MSSFPALERPPEARAETVEDLVHLVRKGRIRVPSFQRGLKWGRQQVLDLFDSVYRGLPIGSLLLFRRDAPATQLHLGPLSFDAPEAPAAWWVVDGQQRLLSLAISLTRPLPLPHAATDPFIVYFDPREGTFAAPSAAEPIPPSTWVPVPLLLDAALLSEWVLDWLHHADRQLVRQLFEAGKRLREYRVPLYIVDTDDPDVLRDIFFRVNNTGTPLTWAEVHDALYGQEGTTPSTVTSLASELQKLGMGRIDEKQLTPYLLALRGLNTTLTVVQHHRKDRDALHGAVAEALPVLRQALSFLRTHAGIPHLQLLPRPFLLAILARFFKLHPTPQPRTLQLLSRWVWRALTIEPSYWGEIQGRSLASLGNLLGEEPQLSALLAIIPRELTVPQLQENARWNSAGGHLALLTLATLLPRSLIDGRVLDTAKILDEHKAKAFWRICSERENEPVIHPGQDGFLLLEGPANRLLLSASSQTRNQLLERLRIAGPKDAVLASHAISGEAAAHLLAGRVAEFLTVRHKTIAELLGQLTLRMAGWSQHDRDRPSIRYLLKKAEESQDEDPGEES